MVSGFSNLLVSKWIYLLSVLFRFDSFFLVNVTCLLEHPSYFNFNFITSVLSANSDPKQVMKGITHGACDYLIKPVRIEELRNIWQHVIRRKKSDSRNNNKSTDDANVQGQGSPLTSNADQNSKFSRKRKDEDDFSEDNGNESEDPSSQKKPRVVWSIELHRKFVAAVNQLGIESKFFILDIQLLAYFSFEFSTFSCPLFGLIFLFPKLQKLYLRGFLT